MTPSHIFFDVNETLIDIAPLRCAVAARLGGGEGQADRWFNGLIEYSLAETLAGAASEFADIAAAVLAMQVAENGGSLALDDAKAIVSDGLGQSEAYRDVPAGLSRLKDAGFSLVALTNSGGDGLHKRLEKAGIGEFFDHALSVQPSGGYKPDRRCYDYGLSETGASADRALMVACHPWDLIGARAAGWQTAFVTRPGKAWYLLADEAEYVADDIEDLARHILEARQNV